MAQASTDPHHATMVEAIKQHSIHLGNTASANVDAFANALHDDWFMIDMFGRRLTKQQELEMLRTTNANPHVKVEDVHVQIHGDTAIVTGISDVKGSYQGKDISGRYRFTQVYAAPAGHGLLAHAKAGKTGVPAGFAMITCITFDLNKASDPAMKIAV
jgi:ketosteroid isomerase-like protein